MFHRFETRLLGVGLLQACGPALIGLGAGGPVFSAQAESPASLDMALVGTYQDTDDDNIGSEDLGSMDIAVTTGWGPGELLIHAEGGSSPQPGEVSSALPEVNGDAGTALDRDGDGRLQISQLYYTLPLRSLGTVTVGLLDATEFLDTTGFEHPGPVRSLAGIANDEATQFLGNTFVNNPVIEFPDYTLGAVWSPHTNTGHAGYTLAATASNGLADNNEASYSELVDIGDDGKGVFAAVEGYWLASDALLARAGIWTNTRDHDRVDGMPDDRANYGIYGLIGSSLGTGHWNIRLGWSDPDVSAGKDFISVATEQPLGDATLGVAVGRTGASDELGPGSDDTLHGEAFVRFEATENLQLSPHIQHIENSGFVRGRDAFVYGLRIGAFFSPG